MADDYVVKSSNITELLSKVRLFAGLMEDKAGINAETTI
jgi:DNA-binding response OmpR family regulator